MSDDIAIVPDEVLYRAIHDLTGLNFDGEAESEALKVVMAKIMDNEPKADELAQWIVLHSLPPALTPLSIAERYSNVQLHTLEPLEPADDPMADDYPTEAYHPEPANLLSPAPEIDSSYIIVLPEILGFDSRSDGMEWKSDAGILWFDLLQTAEKQLKASTHHHVLPHYIRKRLDSHISHPGKNYSVLEVKTAELQSETHFLFGPDNLYVVVTTSPGFSSKFSVPLNDTQKLATNLVDAFKGRVEYAELALSSMSKAFHM